MTTKMRDITFMPNGTSRCRSMRGLLAVAVCGLLGALTAPPARAQLCTSPGFGQCASLVSNGPGCDPIKFQDGNSDNFCPGVDPAFPRLPFLATGACSNAVSSNPVDYDFPTIDRVFCDSFSTKNPIGGTAVLEIRLKALGSSVNDSIAFYGGNSGSQLLWCSRIGDLLGVPWQSPLTETFCLNLSALPPNQCGTTTNILAPLLGNLDIQVQDDTSVDYAVLYQAQCEKTVPTLSEWGLGALALLLLSGVAIKFGRGRVVASGN